MVLATTNAAERIGDWPFLLVLHRFDIYEIGSGTGALARALTDAGYHVVATDIRKRESGRVAVTSSELLMRIWAQPTSSGSLASSDLWGCISRSTTTPS